MEQENTTGEKVYCFGWGFGCFGLMLGGGVGADCQGTQNNGEYRPLKHRMKKFRMAKSSKHVRVLL